MLRRMEIVKLLTAFALIGLASASPSFALDPKQDPNNPNCSPGVKGCTANYPTSDVTKNTSAKNSAYDQNNGPNCTPGLSQPGCILPYATTDHSKDNPLTPAK
jgi:hypothetical protein